MKNVIILLLSVCSLLPSSAQENFQQEIRVAIQEGKTIYRLESVAQMAEKNFKEKYQGKELADGFITYIEADKIKAVFYTLKEKGKVIGNLAYGFDLEEKNVQVDFLERELTPAEMELHKLKTAALSIIKDGSSFSSLPGTRFSVVPIIANGVRKAFVLSLPEKKGSVIFGNDHMLTFDAGMKLSDKLSLHKTLATVTYEPGAGSANDKGSSHTHVPAKGDMITSTDVAVLLLFQSLTGWTHHTFIGENYLFFWSYTGPDIQIIPKGVPKMK